MPADTLPPDVALPPVGGVTVAAHARDRTLADVVRAIADANELLRRCGPVSVVVDALDEAAGDAPEAVATMLSRLAAHPDRHVVVGTRVGVRVRAAWRQEGTWFVTRPDGRLLLLCRDDTLVDEYPGPTQGAFHRAAGGLRLLATHRRGLLLFTVPERGELPLLATSPEQVNRFALDHDGDVPVVVTLSIGDTARVATHSLAGDAFTPWAAPWSVTTTAAAEVAPAVRDGRAFVAVGDGNGHLAAWSCPRGGRAVRLLATDLDSGVVDLAWRPDGRLAAWCRSGVVELAFG